MRRRLGRELACRQLRLQVALQYLLHGLANMQDVEHLHVREATEKNDALDQLLGVLHLVNGYLPPLLGVFLQVPSVEQLIVQRVLVDDGELVAQRPAYGSFASNASSEFVPAPNGFTNSRFSAGSHRQRRAVSIVSCLT